MHSGVSSDEFIHLISNGQDHLEAK